MPYRIKILLSITLLLCNCELFLFKDQLPPKAPQREEIWQEIKKLLSENYVLYNENQIDHDSLINTVSANLSEQPIDQTLQELLDKIKDSEISISSPTLEYRYRPKFKPYLSNPHTDKKIHILGQNEAFAWGEVIGQQISYLNIKKLDKNTAVGDDQTIAKIFDTLEISSSRLIIDLRNTSGKNWEKSQRLAAHLIDYSGVYMHWKSRSSRIPKQGAWTPIEIQNKKQRGFAKIAILQSRNTNLTAETLIFALKLMKTITTVGDTTAGNLVFTETTALPSGYFVSYPSIVLGSFEKEIFHGQGLPPDYYTPTSQKDDFILKKAINLLK